MEMTVDVSASRAGGLQKGHSGRLLALEPAPRAAYRGIDKQARSPRRLLEQPAEAAHRFHPVRLIEAQPLHDWGQVLWNRPALVRAELPARPIEQHEKMIDVDRQEPYLDGEEPC